MKAVASGLAEHLRSRMKLGAPASPYQIARFLGRDVQMMLKNGGAVAALREELAKRAGVLRNKRVIVWEVAMHGLAASKMESDTADWVHGTAH